MGVTHTTGTMCLWGLVFFHNCGGKTTRAPKTFLSIQLEADCRQGTFQIQPAFCSLMNKTSLNHNKLRQLPNFFSILTEKNLLEKL
jgi:hypothetical protein